MSEREIKNGPISSRDSGTLSKAVIIEMIMAIEILEVSEDK